MEDRAMQLIRFRFTIRRFMIWTAVLAVGIAYLVAADQEGRVSHCGYPLIHAMWVLSMAAGAFNVIRLVVSLLVFAIRHPS
jgi:hypothetical protein